jgi:hypothetical protein
LHGLRELLHLLVERLSIRGNRRSTLWLRHRRRLLQHQNNAHNRGQQDHNLDDGAEFDLHEGSEAVSLGEKGPEPS